jgi:hypothetical protein
MMTKAIPVSLSNAPTGFADWLVDDLRAALLNMKGFSPRIPKYMRAFAMAWPDGEFVQGALAQLPWGHNLPTELQTSLPSIQQIERELGDLS